MNDPMPPESLPPESTSFSSAIPPVNRNDDDQPAAVTGRTDRRKYDELIAVVLALLGMGGILWWTLGKGNSMAGKLPFGDAIAGRLGAAAGGAGVKAPDFAKGVGASKPLFGAGQTNGGRAELGTEATKSGGATQANNGNNLAALLAGGAAGAGAAATAGGAEAAPTQPAGDETPANTESTAAPTTPAIETPAAQTTPEIVEEDKLPEATAARKFSDVPADSKLAPYVDALSSRGVLDLFDDGTLNPDTPITRAEFANLVSKAFGKPRIKPAIDFTDTPQDDASKAAITEATRTGFMTGFPDKSFKPDLQIPRYQMQVAIVTGTQFAPGGDPVQALSKFSDREAIPNWAIPKVATAVGSGVLPTPDKDITELAPEQSATRGEAVVMLHEALVKEGKLPAVQ